MNLQNRSKEAFAALYQQGEKSSVISRRPPSKWNRSLAEVTYFVKSQKTNKRKFNSDLGNF
eukprot:3908169-Pyramimonas_sp.AAC.1